MSRFIQMQKLAWGLVAILLAALLVLLAAFLGWGHTISPVHAQSGTGNGSDAPQAVNGGPFGCTISNIAVFPNRIHVHCTTAITVGTNNVSYFAALGDSAHMLSTNRYLVLLNTAYALGKKVYIYYLDNPANNPPGCNTGDCRAIDWMFIVP
jgi:hypothetical protein